MQREAARPPRMGRGRWRWLGALAVAGLMAAGCGAEGGREDYSIDGDTGAAAPAATPDQSTADMVGTDSTLGRGGRTGQPAMAGDTLGARAADSAAAARPPR